jgi:hypothetical protein
VGAPLGELTRKQARAEFDKLMSEKGTRIELLRDFLRANSVELRSSDDGVQELNDWFLREVEPSLDKPGRLKPIWYAVVNDIALFLGDVMIERNPGLKWEMYTKGKTNISYHRHVIMGFSKSPNPDYNVDIDRVVGTVGHRVVGDLEVDPDLFVSALSSVEKWA